jgi:peptide/nickel transport system permease protein
MNSAPDAPRAATASPPSLDVSASAPAPSPTKPKRAGDRHQPTAALSQGQLIRRRFARHRLAVFALALLVVFYGVAAFAEFIAPYGKLKRDIDHAYAPPQVPRFDFTHGLHVFALRQHIDPITFQKSYREDSSIVVPLSFFARGTPAKLFGLFPIEHHLLAIDRDAYARMNTAGAPSGEPLPAPTFFFVGADKYGRDVLSRVIYGARISLSIGIASIVVTFLLGLTIGGVSGYFGGRTDGSIQRVIEVINAFPHLPLWLALAAVVPTDWPALRVYFAITIVLSALNWTGLARVVRGKFLALREEEYALAARLLGAGHARIIFRHLLPGCASHIIVVLTMSVPAMILGETALSFLGLGLRQPVVSWGVMLQDCVSLEAVASYPWLLMPVLPIVLTVLCFNFLGDGLRDTADPYSSR